MAGSCYPQSLTTDRAPELEQVRFLRNCSEAIESLSKAGSPRGLKPAARTRLPRGAPPIIHCYLSVLILFIAGSLVVAQPASPSPADEGKRGTTHGIREFSPGLRIDWGERVIEVDATVVLRRGSLELLACSPGTREHESIFVVGARPRDVFHALGLIGMEPGSPASFDREKNEPIPPTGDRLAISVRYADGRETTTVDARTLLLDVRSKLPPTDLVWVFAGSRSLASGEFGADLDGTIACVVDFDTALIAIDTSQTASDDGLWLRANTDAIPPMGTKCTLIIGGADSKEIDISVQRDGTLRFKNAAIEPRDVAVLIGQDKPGGGSIIVLIASEGVEAAVARNALRRMVAAGVDERLIRIEHPAMRQPADTRLPSPSPGG